MGNDSGEHKCKVMMKFITNVHWTIGKVHNDRCFVRKRCNAIELLFFLKYDRKEEGS